MSEFSAACLELGFYDRYGLTRFDGGGAGDCTNNHGFGNLDFFILAAFDFHEKLKFLRYISF